MSIYDLIILVAGILVFVRYSDFVLKLRDDILNFHDSLLDTRDNDETAETETE